VLYRGIQQFYANVVAVILRVVVQYYSRVEEVPCRCGR
jgi:hypothetical protein